jgi:hypothetical protein
VAARIRCAKSNHLVEKALPMILFFAISALISLSTIISREAAYLSKTAANRKASHEMKGNRQKIAGVKSRNRS